MVFGYAPATNGLHGQLELLTGSAKSRFLLVICCAVPLKLHGVEGFCLEDWADQGVHLDGGVRLHKQSSRNGFEYASGGGEALPATCSSRAKRANNKRR